MADDPDQATASAVEVLPARRFGWPKGQSGNPAGRPPGIPHRDTTAAREMAREMIDDPVYRETLRQRLLDGTAGAMEPLMWFYAHGKPKEQTDEPASALAQLPTDELRRRLADALDRLR